MPTEGTAEIIISKQRNGPIGEVRLSFLKKSAKFERLEIGRSLVEPVDVKPPDKPF
jgi:replicative DNA helicase